jgi:hypothetical protein
MLWVINGLIELLVFSSFDQVRLLVGTFNEVLDACAILARELIYIRTTETHPKITSNPGRFHPYFEVQS